MSEELKDKTNENPESESYSENEFIVDEDYSNQDDIPNEYQDEIIVESYDTNLQNDYEQPAVQQPVEQQTTQAQYYYNPTGEAGQYYREKYENNGHKKSHGKTFTKMLFVALAGAIIGGMIFASAFLFVLPKLNIGSGQLNPVTINTNSGDISLVSAVAKKTSPSIVGVKLTVIAANTIDTFPFAYGNQQAQQQQFEGSGIVYNSDGYIVTNNHVIANAYNSNNGTMDSSAKIEVYFPSDVNKSYSATVVGRDEKTDLAILKIDGKGFPTAEFGNSDNAQVGDIAIAIGNPGGMELVGSVSMGVISGLNRTIKTDDNKTMTLIQTDAAINSGNSGGALCNVKGEVIGVNVLKIAATGYEGLGFSIPSNTVKAIADNIIKNGYVTGRPLIGVSFDTRFTADIAKQNSLPEGLYVADVTLMGPADKAGLKKGDIVTKFNGNAVTKYDDLVTDIAQYKPGDTVKIEYYRESDKSTKTIDITFGESKS